AGPLPRSRQLLVENPAHQVPDVGLRLVAGYFPVQSRLNLDFRYHLLRHSFATHLLGAGVPLAHVSTLLGHTTTERYAKVVPEYLRAAVSLLDRPTKQHKTAHQSKRHLGKTRISS
ncbi:MAG: tyrosine-type recombinase/integrase, partial [Nitrospirae bacterium]|nr:tyrosine-type recombinase/integrase [Nitrospirota bacterium]